MNRHLRSEPGMFGPYIDGNDSTLEGFVSLVSRSAGVVMLFAAMGAIAAHFVF